MDFTSMDSVFQKRNFETRSVWIFLHPAAEGDPVDLVFF